MSEELESALSQLIQKTLNGMDAAVGFGQEQLPDVIRQLITWNFSYLIGLTFIWLTIFSVLSSQYRKLAKHERESSGDAGFTYVFGTLLLLITFSFSAAYFFEALKIYIAPKVWLLEYAANLIK